MDDLSSNGPNHNDDYGPKIVVKKEAGIADCWHL